VEINKYGWFWECPNGKTCIYRHALPPGFQLKKVLIAPLFNINISYVTLILQDKKKEEKNDKISLEDLIEKERAALGSTLTKVNKMLTSLLLTEKR